MTLLFWLLIALLIGATLYALLKPLLRQTYNDSANHEQHLSKIYRERAAQLKAQFDCGELDEQAYQQAREELEVALAQDLPAHPQAQQASQQTHSMMMPLLIGITVPVTALILYMNLGSISVLENHASPENVDNTHSITEMIANLELRLQGRPEDIEGWMMLGRSYTAVGQLEKAKQAYTQAYQRAPGSPEIMLSLAEVTARMQNNVLSGEPEQLIEAALQLNPKSWRGRLLKGMVAFQQNKRDTALNIWQALLDDQDTSAEERELLKNMIAGLQQPASAEPTGNNGAGVSVSVSLAPALATEVAAGDTLFIFARAAQGPRMPLAIIRKPVTELPMDIRLDDSNAMLPEMKLSAFESVIIGARISKSGNAAPAAGDLQGLSEPVNPQQNPTVKLIIAEKLQ